MGWDEWEELKGRAADRRTAHTRLNQYPGDQGDGDGDLVVHQDDLGAVGHEAFVLHDHLRKQADIAGAGAEKGGEGSTARAAAALKKQHFAMGPAMGTTVEYWTKQVKAVLQACADISNHLDYSAKLHTKDDTHIAASLPDTPTSKLNDLFK
ncbi:hypothetical protein [Streptomyces sp. NPDC050560]|uniref:hypothetical protein n=1 Tax=Streptomyces sp. NPDC050560 TaxID=3365630 RepID=UPI0037B61476